MRNRLKLAPLSLAVAAASSAMADNVVEPKPLLEITVMASPLGRTADELVQPIVVLKGEELDSKRRATIGQSLEGELGIATTDFGAGAGRPVIRGQAGPRVEVLSNGMSAMDVSDLSPDHAVAINPLLAEQIEVLKGPATLLYGNGATGGAVNVVDKRLPDYVTPGSDSAIEAFYGNNARERGLALDLNHGSGPHQWHVDFLRTATDDYRIPGTAGSDGSGSRRKLANSDTDTVAGAISHTHVTADDDVYGISLSHQASRYGLPVEADAFIDMKQTRVDTNALWRNPSAQFESLRLRLSASDYEHTEFEDLATPGTRFLNEQYQLRLEGVHQSVWGMRGVLGMQANYRDFQAVGDEAYVPPVTTKQLGLFAVEERATDFGKLEFGARVEQVEFNPSGNSDRRFTPLSFSFGSIVDVGKDSHIKATYTQAERAPVAEELYANGPHAATASFEVGNSNMRRERAHNAELGFDHHQGRVTLEGNVFYKRVSDYIYASEGDGDGNGLIDRVDDQGGQDDVNGEFLLLNYRQADATFRGYEAAANIELLRSGPLQLSTRVFTDHVRGRLDASAGVSDRDLPRITPTRYGVSLHAHAGRVASNLSLIRAEAQEDVASFETTTKGYNLLNADVNYRLPLQQEASLYLRGTNLLNDDIRRATSFTKDAVPAAGRGITVGVKLRF